MARILCSLLIISCVLTIQAQGKVVDSMVYDKPTEWKIYSAGAPVHAFTLHKDQLWMAIDDGVLAQSLNKKADVKKVTKLGSIPSTDVSAMVTDSDGRIWLGTKNGLAMKSGSAYTVFTSENGIPDNNVTAVLSAPAKRIWVGTEKGAAYYKDGAWTKVSTKDGLVSDKVQALAADSNGNIWIGTDKGISVYNGVKWTTHSMKNGMSWNDTKVITVDARKGVVWAAVGEKDVNAFDGKAWNTYMEIQEGITSIMVDSQSRIWFGSPNGVIKFNGEEWISDSKVHGVPVAKVYQMFRDEGGNLWFAMESGVLRMANPYPF